jgi:hypothetical protein
MLVTTVPSPEAFGYRLVEDPLYARCAKEYLRGVIRNGLILVDSQNELRQCLGEAIANAPASTRSLFEEILKMDSGPASKRIVQCRPGGRVLDWSDGETVSFAAEVQADAVVVAYLPVAEDAGTPTKGIEVSSLAVYDESRAEEKRRRYAEDLPHFENTGRGELRELLMCALRYTTWLRFYDPIIGKVTRRELGAWRDGLGFVLECWREATRCASRRESAVEIVTKFPAGGGAPAEVAGRIQDALVAPLQSEFGVDFAEPRLKQDHHGKFHARHLQTESLPIHFDRSFDLFETRGPKRGELRRQIVTLDNGAREHLREIRDDLRDVS